MTLTVLPSLKAWRFSPKNPPRAASSSSCHGFCAGPPDAVAHLHIARREDHQRNAAVVTHQRLFGSTHELAGAGLVWASHLSGGRLSHRGNDVISVTPTLGGPLLDPGREY